MSDDDTPAKPGGAPPHPAPPPLAAALAAAEPLGRALGPMVRGLTGALAGLTPTLAPLIEQLRTFPQQFPQLLEPMAPEEIDAPCRCVCPLAHRPGICAGEAPLFTLRAFGDPPIPGPILTDPLIIDPGAHASAEQIAAQIDAILERAARGPNVCGACHADMRGLMLAVIEHDARRPAPVLLPERSSAR